MERKIQIISVHTQRLKVADLVNTVGGQRQSPIDVGKHSNRRLNPALHSSHILGRITLAQLRLIAANEVASWSVCVSAYALVTTSKTAEMLFGCRLARPKEPSLQCVGYVERTLSLATLGIQQIDLCSGSDAADGCNYWSSLC